jgi:poly-gamma-glutamate capsule biosynthesis protein CapA/YwtB (metallophosphatase superfamily)
MSPMDRRAFLKQCGPVLAAAASVSHSGFAQSKETMRLALTGDVILSRHVSMLTSPRFLDVARLLQSADCAFGNCELVMAARDEGDPSAAGASLSVVVDPSIAEELRWIGYDIMGTANNHALDYGPGGVSSNLSHLSHAGIVGAGTGVNLQEAAAARYADTPSGRVALVGCASTFAPHAPAVLARGDFPGVAGLNAIRRDVRWQLPKTLYDGVQAAADALKPVQVSGALFPTAPGLTFLGASFIEGPSADLLSEPHPADRDRIASAVGVGRRNARLVLVSIHAHELYRELTTPDPFVPVLAHAAIDAGADVFITHGSHYLAGIEMYRGKPIFYGLGDFFFQYETVPGFAADTYEAYGLAPHTLDPSLATAKIPLAGGRKLWETVVPVLDYESERLAGVSLYPVTLGMSEPRHQRGTPMKAEPQDAERIVTELSGKSRAYGTSIRWDGARGVVAIS